MPTFRDPLLEMYYGLEEPVKKRRDYRSSLAAKAYAKRKNSSSNIFNPKNYMGRAEAYYDGTYDKKARKMYADSLIAAQRRQKYSAATGELRPFNVRRGLGFYDQGGSADMQYHSKSSNFMDQAQYSPQGYMRFGGSPTGFPMGMGGYAVPGALTPGGYMAMQQGPVLSNARYRRDERAERNAAIKALRSDGLSYEEAKKKLLSGAQPGRGGESLKQRNENRALFGKEPVKSLQQDGVEAPESKVLSNEEQKQANRDRAYRIAMARSSMGANRELRKIQEDLAARQAPTLPEAEAAREARPPIRGFTPRPLTPMAAASQPESQYAIPELHDNLRSVTPPKPDYTSDAAIAAARANAYLMPDDPRYAAANPPGTHQPFVATPGVTPPGHGWIDPVSLASAAEERESYLNPRGRGSGVYAGHINSWRGMPETQYGGGSTSESLALQERIEYLKRMGYIQ